MVLKDKVFMVALVFVTLAGWVSADVFIDADVFHDADVFYDGIHIQSISLIYPSDALSQSHNAEFFFNASYISAGGDPFLNITLHVWDSGSAEYFVWENVSASRPENGSVNFGSWTFPEDSYLWGVQACNESVGGSCIWSSNQSFITTDITPFVTLLEPLDGQYDDDGDLDFIAYVNQTGDGWGTLNLSIWNLTGLYHQEEWTYPITPHGDGSTDDATNRTFNINNMLEGNYSWTVEACDVDSDCFAPTNFSLFIQEITPESSDSSGECLTDRGYSFSYSAAAGVDHVRFNLTGLGEYLADVDLRNVWVEFAPAYKYSDNHLVVNTTLVGNKQFIVWIGGFNYDKAHAAGTPSIDLDIDLEISNFTRMNPAYWVEVRDESSGDYWNYSLSSSHVLDSYCENYAPERVDLKNTINVTRLLITSKEPPLFHGILDGIFNRKIRVTSSSETVLLYFLSNDTLVYNIDFNLEDYINTFSRSYLQVYKKVNETLALVWQDQWYHLEIPDVSLANDSYVQYVVYTPDDTRVIAWDHIDSSDDVTISIYEHKISDAVSYLDSIELGFSSSYAASTVGAVWNTSLSGDIYNLSFSVNEYNGTQYNEIFGTTLNNPADQGSYDYIVPDQNKTYYVAMTAYLLSEDSFVSISDKERLRETEVDAPFYDAIGIPDGIWGLSADDIYTGISILLILAIATMWGRINTASGGLMTAIIIGLVYKFRWFREMTLGLVTLMIIMAIIYKLVEDRRKQEQ